MVVNLVRKPLLWLNGVSPRLCCHSINKPTNASHPQLSLTVPMVHAANDGFWCTSWLWAWRRITLPSELASNKVSTTAALSASLQQFRSNTSRSGQPLRIVASAELA